MKPITDMTLVTDDSRAKTPIVIKCEARWCQRCRAMTPPLLESEKELGGRVDIFVSRNA
jgi:thioredoxin